MNQFLNTRNLIILQEGASIELIESTIISSTGVRIVQNAYSEILIKDQAHASLIIIQQGNSSSALIGRNNVYFSRNSRFDSHTFTLSGAFTRNNLNLYFREKGSEAHMNGFYKIGNSEFVDNHTLADHQKSHCISNELYKGILSGKSNGVFNGKVFVHPDAQKTNAYQQNNSILLSPEANMNSKPELEIFADDVKCSHGSTIGQLNADALFYLKARGISEESGKQLMIRAFAHDITRRLKNEVLQDHINELID